MSYLLVGIGSALGGIARYWCSSIVAAALGSAFPWGILLVNVLGSGLIGVLMGAIDPSARWPMTFMSRDAWVQFFMIGVMGGYTTFSSFSLQTFDLLRANQWWQAGTNIFLSVVLCLLATACGFWITTSAR